jgi:hypothetical protein
VRISHRSERNENTPSWENVRRIRQKQLRIAILQMSVGSHFVKIRRETRAHYKTAPTLIPISEKLSKQCDESWLADLQLAESPEKLPANTRNAVRSSLLPVQDYRDSRIGKNDHGFEKSKHKSVHVRRSKEHQKRQNGAHSDQKGLLEPTALHAAAMQSLQPTAQGQSSPLCSKPCNPTSVVRKKERMWKHQTHVPILKDYIKSPAWNGKVSFILLRPRHAVPHAESI